MNDVGTKVGTTPTGNTPGMSSYANVTSILSRKALNFCTLFTPARNEVNVVVPVESIRAISERFANTAYGFFFGKRVAYPVFISIDGLDAVLENGPWFIFNNPLILKKWNPNVNLFKEDMGNVLVWVKLHGVPVTAFSEDGLSAIATKLGTPLMLNSYTSDMCIQSCGRSSYVRPLIEVRVDVELKNNTMVAMPKLVEEGLYWKGRACIYFRFPFTIKLAIGLNVFLLDPSPSGRILLLVSLLNAFHREGLQNSEMTSKCSNNIKVNLILKHGLVSRTYSKKSLIMASIFGCKSKYFLTMSIPPQGKPSIKRLVVRFVTKTPKNPEALLDDLALYENENWNDPRDFAKPVKAISLSQDVPSTSDRHLIELENQVQRLMEAHLAPKSSFPVNKITSSCEICCGPYDTLYCLENPEQAFVDYVSSRTNKAGGKWYTFKPEQNNLGDIYNPSWKSHPNLRWRQPQNFKTIFSNPPNCFQPNGLIPNHSFSNNPQSSNSQSNLKGLVSSFMASRDARFSKFEADFNQEQGNMTNKIDAVLKAINDRITGALPSDTVKNPKLNVNLTSLISFARPYPTHDPSARPISMIRSMPSNHVLAKQAIFKKSSFLEVLAHALIYNAMLDKYVESQKLGKNRPAFIQGKMPEKMKDPGLFTLPCSLGDSKPFDTLANLGTKCYRVRIVKNIEVHIGKLKILDDFYVIDMDKDHATPLLVGRGFLATTNAVIDYRKAKIAVGEGVTRSIFVVKEIDLGEEEVPYWTTLGKREYYTPRPSTDGIGARTPYYAKKDFIDYHIPGEWKIARDVELNPFKYVLVFRRMVEFLVVIPINLKRSMWESEDLIKNTIDWNKPPKRGDGAWHAKIRLIDPDGEEFTKTFHSILTTRKLFEKENPSEIIDLDHFHDS
ncbi:MAK10-like protein [Tanacetum coccineum]